MSINPPSRPQAVQAAAAIQAAFHDYQAAFRDITLRSKPRFEACDWHGVQADAVERLELYKVIVSQIVKKVGDTLQERLKERGLWAAMKLEYRQMISCCTDYELAETFFNSVTRRIFSTVGVDQSIEFIDSDFEPRMVPGSTPIYTAYPACEPDDLPELIAAILSDHPYACGYQDIERDAALAGKEIEREIVRRQGKPGFERLDILHAVFYRNFGAYLVGRVILSSQGTQEDGEPLYPQVIPLVICLRNDGAGVYVDAVLLDEDEISIVFSFTRSYFHVETDQPHDLVRFIKTIIPLKRLAELYISIGYNKHGKTELYRDLLRRLESTSEQFEIAPGERGMVMAVFIMPSYDMAFKIIKDRIDPPKTTTRQEVMERYDLVFKHDRAGRLVDAQEFEHLTFERERFSPALLAELQAVAPNTVVISDGTVDIKHLYIERRMTPLNLYVKQVDEQAARQAVIDYGNAIKDLAATNIFPGDILLKNFGVTRHGRVIFYDYDELCQVTDCKFRKMPQARSFDDEFEAEPWFYVGPLDIFPEEFNTFLGLLEPLRSVFTEHHADLFGTEFWKAVQARHRAGEVADIVPYPASRRLRPLFAS